MKIKTKDGHIVTDGDYVYETTIVSNPEPKYQPLLSVVGRDLKNQKRCWKGILACSKYCDKLNADAEKKRRNRR